MNENELHVHVDALLHSLSDRLTASSIEQCSELNDVGEWAELLDNFAATLADERPVLTASEIEKITAALGYFDIPLPGYDFLNARDSIIASLPRAQA